MFTAQHNEDNALPEAKARQASGHPRSCFSLLMRPTVCADGSVGIRIPGTGTSADILAIVVATNNKPFFISSQGVSCLLPAHETG